MTPLTVRRMMSDRAETHLMKASSLEEIKLRNIACTDNSQRFGKKSS